MTPTTQPLIYHCPNCKSPVEVKPDQMGEVAICPSCQQAFKPELPSAKPAEAPQAGIVLPPGVEAPQTPPPPAIPASSPEEVGETIHLNMWRRYPFRCLGYVAGIVAGTTLVIWLLTQRLEWLALIAGVALAYLVFRAVSWWLQMRNTTLTITDRRCVVETGVFSRQSTEFGKEDISDVRVSQDPIMRVLNVGDLVIVSNNGTKKEIVVMAVPDPETVVRKIAVASPPVAEQPAETSAA